MAQRARRQAAGADDTVIEVRPIKITEATAPSQKSPVKYAAINEKLHNDTLITTQDMESSGDGVVKSTSFKRKFKDRHRNRSHSKYRGVRNIRRTYDDENEPLMRIQPKEQTSQRRIPWFARPLVVILPFLKDWGGFIT